MNTTERQRKREYDKRRYIENREKIMTRNREWNRKNKEKVLERTKTYQKENPHISKKSKEKWIENNPEKFHAHQEVMKAIKRGEIEPIIKCKCKLCNKNAKQYHHPNYDKPLKVIPLCIKCHNKIHHE